MANTPVSIINLGLGKIGADKISSIVPPKTTTERTCAEGYPQWRDSEMTKRRWVFATELRTVTLVATLTNVNLPYVYDLPADYLRAIRKPLDRWQIRGKQLFSQNATEIIEMLVRKPEAFMDALFVDVLAARAAKELVESKTQSNEKWNKAQTLYKEAINEAGRLNAFVLEPDNTTLADDNSDWLRARWGGPFA
jgi:hypothetical protein